MPRPLVSTAEAIAGARLGSRLESADAAAHTIEAVKPNRSIPAAHVVPVLVCPDVRAAVAWLQQAFRFAERVRIGEDHRSQLSVARAP